MKRSALYVACLASALLFSGCSDSPKTEVKKEPEKPAEPLTGRQAFQQMYPGARAWARDAAPLQLLSLNLTEVKSAKGRAGAWQGTFVSLAQRKSKSITWSAMDLGTSLHKGVFAGPENDYSASPGAESVPFDVVAIRTDSDAAYDVALQQKETEAYLKKNPDKPVMFILEKNRRFPDVSWRVVFGESVGTSDYSVFVDATTGKYLQKIH